MQGEGYLKVSRFASPFQKNAFAVVDQICCFLALYKYLITQNIPAFQDFQ